MALLPRCLGSINPRTVKKNFFWPYLNPICRKYRRVKYKGDKTMSLINTKYMIERTLWCSLNLKPLTGYRIATKTGYQTAAITIKQLFSFVLCRLFQSLIQCKYLLSDPSLRFRFWDLRQSWYITVNLTANKPLLMKVSSSSANDLYCAEKIELPTYKYFTETF